MGQTITLSANPLLPLPAQKGVPNWNQIQLLIERWQPDAFVVGIPLNMDATFQAMTIKAKKFVAQLSEKFMLPVHEVDERLTTVEAREYLFNLGGARALNETSVDSFAAKLILEAWMRSLPTPRSS